MNRIDRFFLWADRFSDTTQTITLVAAIVLSWSMFTLLVATVLR